MRVKQEPSSASGGGAAGTGVGDCDWKSGKHLKKKGRLFSELVLTEEEEAKWTPGGPLREI